MTTAAKPAAPQADLAQSNAEGIANLTKTVDTLVKALSKTPAQERPSFLTGAAPAVREGEDPMTSRGFSFGNMIGVLTGVLAPEQAKVEVGMHNQLKKHLVTGMGAAGYRWGGLGAQDGVAGSRFLAPLATSFLPHNVIPASERYEMKSLVAAGVDGSYDLPDEMAWIKRRMVEKKYGSKAMSWLNELTGGALVAPPEQGELIELLRNKEALVNAGARTVPLPPQGRLVYPRQTSPSSAYWIGESAPITDSTPGTGEVALQGKKLAVRIIAPNELIRFANPAAEALMRDDMTKTLALTLDLAGLEGRGSDTVPRGIINYPGINRVNSSAQTADGDRFVAQDIYRMIAIVEENNGEFETFVMRPKSLYKYYQLRADAVGQGDGAGAFVFNLIREAGMGCDAMLGGYKVVKSTQVSQTITKGNNSNLTYVLGGQFSDVLIGMFGAIEFASTTQGDTAFTNDQTWVRGILTADIQLRHESVFSLISNLNNQLGNAA